MRIRSFLALACALLLLAWLVFQRSGAGSSTRSAEIPAASQAQRDARPSLEAPSDASMEVGRELPTSALDHEPGVGLSPASMLDVRSSIGIPLLAIERESQAGAWTRIELDHGRCARASLAPPCRVRGAGHLAREVAASERDVVLEPDAALVLEGSTLRECVSSITPFDRYVAERDDESTLRETLRSTSAWGWVSDTRWAIAVSSAPDPRECPPSQRGAVVLHWRDGRRADIQLDVHAGTRGTWSVPCASKFACAALDARIVRPADEQRGRLRLSLARVIEGRSDGRLEEFPWGHVAFSGDDVYWVEGTLPSDADVWHLAEVPTGSRLALAANDESTHAYGRLVFVHDGSPRTLTLREALNVSATLVSAENAAPVAIADVSWHGRERGRDVWNWQAQALSLALAADGSFTLRGPEDLIGDENVALDPPTSVLLHVVAPGFEELEREFPTQGATKVDCGELRLVPAHAELLLAPGHGLTRESVRWMLVLASSAPDVWWTIRDAVPAPDGVLALHLLRSSTPGRLDTRGDPDGRAWPSAPAAHLVIHVQFGDENEPRAFERQSDGAYAAVARRACTLDVECRALPAESRDWTFGWRWRELFGVVGRIAAADLGQHVSLSFSAPIDGATLYWSADGMPPAAGARGGSVPIDALLRSIVLE